MVKKAERIAREARIACEKWRQYFKYNIDQYHQMHSFVLGRQWEEEEEDMLKSNKKVPLQFNKLATLINTLLGEQQQNTPQLEVVPLSDCDEQTAQIRALLVKDIMLSTDAKTVYQVAACQAFVGGYGAFLVDTEYTYSKSFELDIVYRYFKDSTRCYWDMGADEVNKTDGMCCGYIMRMSRPKFRSIYGKEMEEKIMKDSGITATKEEIALATDPNLTDDSFAWSDEESITINHYYKRKFVKDTLYKLSNGRTLNQEELDELIDKSQSQQQEQMYAMDESMYGGQEPTQDMDTNAPDMEMGDEAGIITLYDQGEPVRIEDSRDTKRSKIIHYVLAGDYILEDSECPSEDLPMPFMDQNSYYDKNGKQVCRPFIIDAVDAQRYLNYLGTQAAYILKISRYDQWIGSKKNVQGLDTQRNWQDPSVIQGMLTYDESPNGNKPEQIRPPELSQSLMQQYERAIEDMYTSTGLYPTRMGQNGNEVSGAAIDARTRQGSFPTYVAFNSVNRAISAGGAIVNQMVPRVIDTERVITLMTPDEGRKSITVNKQMDAYGELIQNDIRKGTFEVRLQAGPSYEGQKEQALQSLNTVLQANPQLLNLFADLYAENLPLANTIEIKNRLKTIVPPAIIEAGKTGKMPQENGQGQPNPEEQMAQAQMQMQQQQMQMEAQFKQQTLEIKKQELQLKAQQMQADLEIEQQKLQAEEIAVMGEIEESKMRYMAETMRTENDSAIAHANNLVKILTHKVDLQPYKVQPR